MHGEIRQRTNHPSLHLVKVRVRVGVRVRAGVRAVRVRARARVRVRVRVRARANLNVVYVHARRLYQCIDAALRGLGWVRVRVRVRIRVRFGVMGLLMGPSYDMLCRKRVTCGCKEGGEW